jgi:hypothetical protein
MAILVGQDVDQPSRIAPNLTKTYYSDLRRGRNGIISAAWHEIQEFETWPMLIGFSACKNGTLEPAERKKLDACDTMRQVESGRSSSSETPKTALCITLAGDPPRLGVVVEAGRAAFVGPHGLTTAEITECEIAWSIF